MEFIVSRYPSRPGCYLVRDSAATVIYVGKARSVRSRLASYFQPSSHVGDTPEAQKARTIAAEAASIEAIVVLSEYEALALESNLIRLHKPRLNRALMGDDAGYHYIQLTGEEHPRFVRFRRHRYVKALDGLVEVRPGRRFGPYMSVALREAVLEFVLDHFGLRTCAHMPKRPCLRYHLGTCRGLCSGHITAREYDALVAKAARLLSAKHARVIATMRSAMETHAQELEFERAAKVREQISALTRGIQLQAVERNTSSDQAFVVSQDALSLVAFCVAGQLVSLHAADSPADALRVASELRANEVIAEWPEDKPAEGLAGQPVKIRRPRSAPERRLLRICAANLEYRLALAEQN